MYQGCSSAYLGGCALLSTAVVRAVKKTAPDGRSPGLGWVREAGKISVRKGGSLEKKFSGGGASRSEEESSRLFLGLERGLLCQSKGARKSVLGGEVGERGRACG